MTSATSSSVLRRNMTRSPGNSTRMKANEMCRHVVLKEPRCAWMVSSSVPNTMSLIHLL